MKKFIWLVFIPSALWARTPSDPLPFGFHTFPSTNVWYTDISAANVSSSNTVWMDPINGHTEHNLHPDFGTTLGDGSWNGIPYNIVYSTSDPLQVIPITTYASQSDTQPAAGIPIPTNVIAEQDIANTSNTVSGDQHLILIDSSTNKVYEMFTATRTTPFGTNWTCAQFSQYFSSSNVLRPDGFTSADAGGLPILPGLIRYDEIQNGVINHAIRFTLSLTHGPHLWPARHDANSGTALNPPFGMRVRMKASVDISGFTGASKIIFQAMKTYGLVLADNGGDWFVGGAPNVNWNDTQLHNDFISIGFPHDIFEVVDESTWIVDPNSGQAQKPPGPPAYSIQMR